MLLSTPRALEQNCILLDEFVIRLLASLPLISNTLTVRFLIRSFFLIRLFTLSAPFS